MDPPVARKLLSDAADYADFLGFCPSEDFDDAELIFGDIPMADQTFTFGKDGKPLYVSGPNGSPSLLRQVMYRLAKELSPKDFDPAIEADPHD